MVQREPEQFQFTNTRQPEGQFIISVTQRFTCSRGVDPLQAACLDEGPQPHEEFKIDGIFAQVALLLICVHEYNLFQFTSVSTPTALKGKYLKLSTITQFQHAFCHLYHRCILLLELFIFQFVF